MNRAKASLGSIFLLFFSSMVPASDYLPSRLSLDVGFDELDGQSRALSIDSKLPLNLRLALSASKHENSNFSSKLLGVRLGSNPLAPVQTSLDYERWESGGEFNIDTLKLLIGFNAEQWSASISPIAREIAIDAKNVRRTLRTIIFSASGFTVALNYFMASGLQAGFSYTEYHYSEDVTRLDPMRSPRIIRIFSPTVLSQAQGLDEYNQYFDLSYPFEWLFFTLTIGQSRSAVDGQYTNMVMLNNYIPLTDEWELSIGVGEQTSLDSSILFGSLGLTRYW